MATDSSEREQKTFYPKSHVADWVGDVADKSSRSESFVLSKFIEELANSVDFEEVRIYDTTAKLEIDKGEEDENENDEE